MEPYLLLHVPGRLGNLSVHVCINASLSHSYVSRALVPERDLGSLLWIPPVPIVVCCTITFRLTSRAFPRSFVDFGGVTIYVNPGYTTTHAMLFVSLWIWGVEAVSVNPGYMTAYAMFFVCLWIWGV